MSPPPAAPRRWHSSRSGVSLAAPPRPPRLVSVGGEPRVVTFDLSATAVIVVDMQNDFCHPQGWLAGIGVDVSPARALIGSLESLLAALRAAGVPVVWLSWGNRPDKVNLPASVIAVYDPGGTGGGIGDRVSELSEAVLTEGSWGAAIVDGLTVAESDIHVPKFRMSGFWDTVLDSALRSLGIRHLLFAGVNVDQCVFATLIDAACAGYDCLLVRDVAGTTSPPFCAEATLYNVRQCFGFVTDSASVTAALAAATAPRQEGGGAG